MILGELSRLDMLGDLIGGKRVGEDNSIPRDTRVYGCLWGYNMI